MTRMTVTTPACTVVSMLAAFVWIAVTMIDLVGIVVTH